MGYSAITQASRVATSLIDKLMKRNLVSRIFPDSSQYAEKFRQMLQKPVTIYAGFDATAKSLHIGHLATLMSLFHFQRQGHRVICVIGDATARLGDPSGHLDDRAKLDRKIIDENAESIEETINRLFENHQTFFDPTATSCDSNVVTMQKHVVLRNSQWYENRNVIDFIDDVFREVRVGRLLQKESIRTKMNTDNGINLSEFCYQVFQAYDWYELNCSYDCQVQIGGSDQEGNINTGHHLIRKLTGSQDSIGLLTPLITSRKTGKKLGKSSDAPGSATPFLHSDFTSPNKLYHFFHKTPDSDINHFLNVFTFYESDVIEDLIKNHLGNSEDYSYCHRLIAQDVCKLVHGETDLSKLTVGAKSKR